MTKSHPQIPEDARVHYIVLKQQPHTQNQTPKRHHHPCRSNQELITPKPNNAPCPTQNKHSTHEQTTQTTLAPSMANQKVELLRKEVIQPHLPVRLPCYDLVPIANPTLDGSSQKG